MFRAIGNDNDRFLHRRPRHIRGAINQRTGIDLPRARDPKKRSRRLRGSCVAPECKVRKVFGGSADQLNSQNPYYNGVSSEEGPAQCELNVEW